MWTNSSPKLFELESKVISKIVLPRVRLGYNRVKYFSAPRQRLRHCSFLRVALHRAAVWGPIWEPMNPHGVSGPHITHMGARRRPGDLPQG